MKILVSVSVPSISESYDVFVPDFVQISSIVPLIVSAVEELSNHVYVSSGQELLCLKEKNILLHTEATLSAYGVKNGDHLLLF